MRLSREAKAYASSVVNGADSDLFPVQAAELVAFADRLNALVSCAFQSGMNHAEARARALARLSKPKGETP
jgi:hypothetical protein